MAAPRRDDGRIIIHFVSALRNYAQRSVENGELGYDNGR
jgi:hypothetical protein